MVHLPKPVQMPKMVALVCLLMTLSALPGRAAGDEVGAEDWQEVAVADSTSGDDFTPGTKFQFQAGVLYRVGGSRFDEGSEPYLITIGFNIPFHWDRQHSTWGAGLHVAFDGDGGPRIGPKLIWRTPAGSTGSDFFQLGTCIYLSSTDDLIYGRSPNGEYRVGHVATPGLYLEAEYGFWELCSLTAAMEAINVEFYDRSSTAGGGGLQETVDMHYYIGGKVEGWGGAGLLTISVAIAGAMVASAFN